LRAANFEKEFLNKGIEELVSVSAIACASPR